MQLLYWSIVDWQSFWGSAALEKSMQSSRRAFSSLHTQQGYLSPSVRFARHTPKGAVRYVPLAAKRRRCSGKRSALGRRPAREKLCREGGSATCYLPFSHWAYSRIEADCDAMAEFVPGFAVCKEGRDRSQLGKEIGWFAVARVDLSMID